MLTGYVDKEELPRYLSMADVFVSPSKYDEAAPLANIEAMSFGLPIIVSDRGGVKEYANDGAIVLNCDEQLPNRLCQSMELLGADKALRQRMGLSFKKVFVLWASAFTWGLIVAVIDWVNNGFWITPDYLIGLIFPISTRKYWFLTVYVALYLLAPFINRLIDVLSQKQHQSLIAVSIVLFSILPSVLPYGGEDGIVGVNKLVVYTNADVAEQVKRIRAEYGLLEATEIIVIDDYLALDFALYQD